MSLNALGVPEILQFKKNMNRMLFSGDLYASESSYQRFSRDGGQKFVWFGVSYSWPKIQDISCSANFKIRSLGEAVRMREKFWKNSRKILVLEEHSVAQNKF